MDGAVPMEPDEVPAVEGEQSPARGGGVGQHVRVGDAFASQAGLLHGYHIVAEPVQLHDYGITEVLVGVQLRHEGQASAFS